MYTLFVSFLSKKNTLYAYIYHKVYLFYLDSIKNYIDKEIVTNLGKNIRLKRLVLLQNI